MEKKPKAPKPGAIQGALQGIGGELMQWASEASHSLFNTDPFGSDSKSDDSDQMVFLSPGQRMLVELIEAKMSKLGFYCKIRVAYIARKEVFSKAKRVGTFFSVLKQYGSLNANALKPAKPMTTKADYFFVKKRIQKKQAKFIRAYRGRSMGRGMKPYILNIEELATLYHFPAFNIKAPLLKRTESKKGEPPTSLPVDDKIDGETMRSKVTLAPVAGEEKPAAPEQQYLPDSLRNYNFANDYFEKKFAKGKVAEEAAKQNNQADESVENSDSSGPPNNLPFIE
jgi:hypothetical protein